MIDGVTDGDALLFDCRGATFVDPAYAFDRGALHGMELMQRGDTIDPSCPSSLV